MRLFLDTNIFLDVAQQRMPHYLASAQVVNMAHQEGNQAFISWHSLATLFYILSRPWGEAKAKEYLADILQWVELAPTQKSFALEALAMEGRDFEDDLQIQCAIAAQCDFLITRNTKDFQHSLIPAVSPEDFGDVGR